MRLIITQYFRQAIVRLIFLLFMLFLAACRSIPEGVEPKIVRGEIIIANPWLFSYGLIGHPAAIVFSLDPNMSTEDLKKFAAFAYQLRNTMPSDPDKRMVARAVSGEGYNPDYFLKVPASVVGNDQTYIAHVWINRGNLSEHYLKPGNSLIFQVYIVNNAPYTVRLLRDTP